MLAYVILAHQEFDNVKELLRGLYAEENIYCICTNRHYMEDAIFALNSVRDLPNVYIISVPPTSWGFVLEAYLVGIDFCINISDRWKSLIILSGADIPTKDQKEIINILSHTTNDQKIILNSVDTEANIDEDLDSTHRLMETLFTKDSSPIFDIPIYNPFHETMPHLEREDFKLFLRPDAARAGWPRLNHSITNLSTQERAQDQKTVYFDTLPPFIRRGLKCFFKDRKVGYGSIYGVLPRDFCYYCTTSQDALFYFALVRSSFSMEESFFATLAAGPEFISRLVRKQIMYAYEVYGARLNVAVMKENVVDDHLFARKAPKSIYMSEIYTEIYHSFGVNTTRLPENQDNNIRCFKDVTDLLSQLIEVADKRFEFGVLGQGFFYDLSLFSDGSLSRDSRWQLGGAWTIKDCTLTFHEGESPYAIFDSIRIVGEKIAFFGRWLHLESCILVLCCDLRSLLTSGFKKLLESQDRIACWRSVDLTEGTWTYWFSGNLVLEVTFLVDGTLISREKDSLFSRSTWVLLGDRLIVLGLYDMPLAVFDMVSVQNSQTQITGVSWGRSIPIEPCFLKRLELVDTVRSDW